MKGEKKINLLTAPLYYANAKPHQGHIYTTVLIDIFKKYLYLNSIDSYLVIGLDEHGQKISRAAEAEGLSINAFLTTIREEYKIITKILGIDYDYFLCTSMRNHKEFVINKLNNLWGKGAIYEGEYSGYYSIRDEEYLTKQDVFFKDGKVLMRKNSQPVEVIKQRAYFLKTRKYFPLIKERLLKKRYLYPFEKTKEIINMLATDDFGDLCISRKKVWGICFPHNKDETLYVWIDALFGYYSALENGIGSFSKYEISSFHLIGKEISKFHAIYLPILLKESDIEIKEFNIYSHQWILFQGKKMSKTDGNVISFNDRMKTIPPEGIRFHLFMNGPLQNDVVFSINSTVEIFEGDLVHKFSNLCYRIANMLKNYRINDWYLLENKKFLDDNDYLTIIKDFLVKINFGKSGKSIIEQFIHLSIIKNNIFRLIDFANSILSNNEPWLMYKEKKEKEVSIVLFQATCLLIFSAFLLSPIIPKASNKLIRTFNLEWIQLKYIWNKNTSIMNFLMAFTNLLKTCKGSNVNPVKIFIKGEE